MDGSFITDLLRAVIRELIRFKALVVAILLLVSFGVLAVGMQWPKTYDTRAILYADVTNIIEPLLRGRAEVTSIDRSEQARERIYTRVIIEQVARKSGLITGTEPVDTQESIISGLRNRISIAEQGRRSNYFSVGYRDSDPDRSFRVLNTVVDVFIEDAAERRRQESRGAFEFIDEQVRSYKRQLEMAEERLKDFRTRNLFISEGSVAQRTNQLRAQIEDLKLRIDEMSARKRSVEEQLRTESRYLASRGRIDSLRERVNALQVQLDTLRLSYRDTHPDVISLKDQILELEIAIENVDAQPQPGLGSGIGGPQENPLYEELRKQAANAEVELQTMNNRLRALERLLDEEHQRAGLVAAKEAELSELTRDYDVTKQIYEEMLERREKARLSMTLDIEGQGVSYKIQEPARFPLQPSGFQFVHFFMLGPLAGLAVSLGLVVAFVVLDPRVRSPNLLANQLPEDVEILGVVPHINTPIGKRIFRTDVILLALVVLVAGAAYTGIGLGHLTGTLDLRQLLGR